MAAEVFQKQTRVTGINKSGVKLQSEGNIWFNWSKYAKDGALDKNVKKDDVVDVDFTFKEDGDGGWIQSLRKVGDYPTQGSGSQQQRSQNGHAGAPAQQHYGGQQPLQESPQAPRQEREPYDPDLLTRKDTLIVRQVVIKEASAILQALMQAKPEILNPDAGFGPDDQKAMITELSEAMEAWIMRGMDEPTPMQKKLAEAKAKQEQASQPKERTADEWWESFNRGRAEMRKAGLSFEEQYDKSQLTVDQIKELCNEASHRLAAAKKFDAMVTRLGDKAYEIMEHDETLLGTRTAIQIEQLIDEIEKRSKVPAGATA